MRAQPIQLGPLLISPRKRRSVDCWLRVSSIPGVTIIDLVAPGANRWFHRVPGEELVSPVELSRAQGLCDLIWTPGLHHFIGSGGDVLVDPVEAVKAGTGLGGVQLICLVIDISGLLVSQ